jgi:CubicO group peptidase (beta-lactamase class C family)
MRIHRTTATPLLFLHAVAFLAQAANPDPGKAGLDVERVRRIPARMQQFVDQGLISGAVTLIQRNGSVGELDAVGMQNIETKTPMKPDTIFEVMSMTKPVTAAGIMILADEGKLSIGDPVEKYLPEFKGMWLIDARIKDSASGRDKEMAMKRPARPITIRDLLTHTSGMREMPPEPLSEIYVKFHYSLKEAVHFYSQQPLEFEPGSKWAYSNTGMATLGRIIEVVSDQPYEKFLDDRIFKPLGMVDTFFYVPEAKKSRVAAVYTKSAAGKLVNMGPGIYRPGAKYPMPEGGLYSTAQDMAAFYQMCLSGGKGILSKAALDAMTTVHTGSYPVWGSGATGYGLGFSVIRSAEGTLTFSSQGAYGHGGAFGTQAWADPKTGLIGVLMIQKFPNDAAEVHNVFRTMANASVRE